MRLQMIYRVALLGGWLLLNGCGGAPQFNAEGRRLLEPLQTAVSARNQEWLDAADGLIAAAHARQEISESDFAALDAVIRQARGGDWPAAQVRVFALSDGQRPSPSDVARLESHPHRSIRRPSPKSMR